MSVTFEQARAILAKYLRLDIGDGSCRVAAWGWENDELFVLALDNTAEATGGDGDSDEDEEGRRGARPRRRAGRLGHTRGPRSRP
jgi:hypothetical protein